MTRGPWQVRMAGNRQPGAGWRPFEEFMRLSTSQAAGPAVRPCSSMSRGPSAAT